MRLLRRSVKPRPPPRRYSRPRSLERLIYSPPARRYIPVIEGVRTPIVSVPPGGGGQWGPCGWRRCSQRVLPGQDRGPLIGSASTPSDPLSPSREAGKESPWRRIARARRPRGSCSAPPTSPAPSPASPTRSSRSTAGTENVVLVGIPTRGAMLARRLGAAVAEFSGTRSRSASSTHAVPRRPAPPPGAAAVEHRPPRRRPRRRAGGAHRRRPDVRPHRAGRARRPRRPRPTPRGAAGRARRPRAPGAADPAPTTWARTCPPPATSRSRSCSRRSTGRRRPAGAASE